MHATRRCLTGCLAAGVGLIGIGLPARAGPVEPVVDDPVFVQGLQWNLDQINAPEAWPISTGKGITVAVLDSGVDLVHEDLRDKIAAQTSCLGADGDPSKCDGSAQDDHGHGTHAAGIAVASTNNGLGMAGVAPDAELMVVRVLSNQCDADGEACDAVGSSADVSAGIRWAADNGADVINLAIGGGTLPSDLGCALCDALQYAWSKGSIPVMAAGNDSELPEGFADQPVVIVSATTREDTRASYSSAHSDLLRSARWPVAAPGGEGETGASDCGTGGTPKGVLSAYWIDGQSNQYACLAGTSMAAAHVSGALAVLLSTGLSPEAAVDRLLATAADLGVPGRDDVFGNGRIDLGAATAADRTPLVPSIAGPIQTGTDSRDLSAGGLATLLLLVVLAAGGTAAVASRIVASASR